MKTFHTYHNGLLTPVTGEVVREVPLALQVNGRELATLIASPHDLRYLVAGFLRLQGFAEKADDFLVLSVCDDLSIASVRLRHDLPEKLRPVLTSGCGTGITFSLETAVSPGPATGSGLRFTPDALFRLMDELARKAEAYRSHGGIHSAAVAGVYGTIVLWAEDIGRHNTLDRIAGEALLRGIDLTGMMLATSGRISAEMVLKAARLGIALVASRTSPTDMALRICEQAGITLVGYLRGGRFTVYAHPERLEVTG